LLADDGFTYREIARVLLIDEESVSAHVTTYKETKKLKISHSPGRPCKLDQAQTDELIAHLTEVTYVKAADICAYVKDKYGAIFTEHSMANWLIAHGFVFKKPKTTPRGADPEKQKEFIKKYEALLRDTPEDEPILFFDAVHPTSETKVSRGWIRKGTDKTIETTASRIE
jgi:transposase